MLPIRTAAALMILALAACGSRDTPEAPPGAVERTTEALERNEAADRKATINRIDAEAEARASASEERIEAIERGEAAQD